MKRLLQKLSLSLFALTFLSNTLVAQKSEQTKKPHPDAVNIALRYLEKQQNAWNLTPEDVRNVRVQDFYATEANGVTHVYILQENANIELFNGLVNVNVLPSGDVLFAGNRFMHDFASTVNATVPRLTPEAAIKAACAILDVKNTEGVTLKNVVSKTEFIFKKGTFVLSDINVKLKYQKMSDQVARLAWDLNIDQPDGQNHWNVRIDALTGELLDKGSYTVHCSISHDHFKHHQTDCVAENAQNTEGSLSQLKIKNLELKDAAATTLTAPAIGGGSYRVFALPTESPSHGAQTLVVDPADAVASPYGWHDTDGAVGADYTITRGNNVHAFLDLTNTNATSGDEPNGGIPLLFDIPYLPTAEPTANKQSATVNLFYVNNMIHDITHKFGFDETSGNFQTKNYTGQSGENDAVSAQALDSYGLTAVAGSNRDNANFSTPPDGTPGRMQMYVWTSGEAKLAHVTAPASLVSDLVTFAAAPNFGAKVTATPVTGNAVFVNDGSASPTLGCETIQNDLTGKIALIDRGTCNFSLKAYKAQQKGAIGVIICFFDDNLAGMASGVNGNDVTIPVVAIKKSDADRLRAAAAAGTLRISLFEATAPVPLEVDGDFDNGIIIHEYTHGISTRLTGGRQNSACLQNAEQAGEGWSDFLGLALTARPSDRGNTTRGIGTFAVRQPITAEGIRTQPYSTDLSVSSQNYGDLPFLNTSATAKTKGAVHSIGEVWTAALWEMYWAMSDKYGWSADFKNVNSGNGKAIRLVMDGMKMQPCSPGFLDGRDAILAADLADFNGENQCLIWEAFAKRGMGYSAKQGTSGSTADNVDAFDKNPFCIKTLKINKLAADFVKAGDQITYTIQVINHKGAAATGVVVTDELAQFTTLVAGSSNRSVAQSGQNLTFNIGTINNNDTVTITYKAATDANKKSIAQFMDDFERGDGRWDIVPITPLASNLWSVDNTYARSGTKSFGVGYASEKIFTDQTMSMLTPLTIRGAKPILSFYQRYNTEPGHDGGIIQISTNNGTSWNDLGDKTFKNPYSGRFYYTVFAIPNQRAWSGTSNKFTPVAIDLSSYIGQSVNFRYRFGSDTTDNREGWFVDDVAVMDMVNYDTRARLTSTQGDTASAGVIGRGTIVEPVLSTPTTEITEGSRLRVFPNPASDFLNINVLVNTPTKEADVSIVSVDGRVMWQKKETFSGAKELLLPVNIAAFPSGMYFVKVRTDEKTLVEKVVKR